MKYQKAFETAAKEARDTYQLIGDCLLVELIPDEDFTKHIKTDDGRVVKLALSGATDHRQTNGLQADKPCFVRVLLVGEGYYKDAEGDNDKIEDVPLESAPGDIILVGRTSIKQFSVFGKLINYGEATLGLVRESDAQMRFRGQEGFDRFFDIVNSAAKDSVEQNTAR